MPMSFSPSPSANAAWQMLGHLQELFASALANIAGTPIELTFARHEWLRAEGRFGGGNRAVSEHPLFNRASINVSHVHYTDDPDKKLASASALSTIIHPSSALIPSCHIHISWTEMKDGTGYWRMMADLNPSVEDVDDKTYFLNELKKITASVYERATKQGDRYFYIPALDRHRGVAHFYLEQYRSNNPKADFDLATIFGITAIDTYTDIFARHHRASKIASSEQDKMQLAYHTLYLFQVLTLDRGTTSGLLVHNENDVGILGSLPAQVDRDLLASWKTKLSHPQDLLLGALVNAIPHSGFIDDGVKKELAEVVRRHFSKYPEALALQAQGDVLPPTVDNHR